MRAGIGHKLPSRTKVKGQVTNFCHTPGPDQSQDTHVQKLRDKAPVAQTHTVHRSTILFAGEAGEAGEGWPVVLSSGACSTSILSVNATFGCFVSPGARPRQLARSLRRHGRRSTPTPPTPVPPHPKWKRDHLHSTVSYFFYMTCCSPLAWARAISYMRRVGRRMKVGQKNFGVVHHPPSLVTAWAPLGPWPAHAFRRP